LFQLTLSESNFITKQQQQQQQQTVRAEQQQQTVRAEQQQQQQQTPKTSNTDRQQRHLAELYAQQRATSPRLASHDEIRGRHISCRPVPNANAAVHPGAFSSSSSNHDNGQSYLQSGTSGNTFEAAPSSSLNSTSIESYDDELSRQLQLAQIEDRRGWEDKRERMLQLREYEGLKRGGSQQQRQQLPLKQNRDYQPQYQQLRPETSTQSTRSETSSEKSNSSEFSQGTWMSQRIGNVVGTRVSAANNPQSSQGGDSIDSDGHGNGSDLRKVRNRDANKRIHQEQQYQQKPQPVQRQTTPPPSGLGCIHEEHSLIENELSFEEIQVKHWSFEQDDFFDPDDNGNDYQEYDNEGHPVQHHVHFCEEPQRSDYEQRSIHGNSQQHQHFNNRSSQYNQHPSQQTSQPMRQKPSLTIDVVSDVSYHDDPSIDMTSSLATNDTNSLTDYNNWKSSQQRSSPTLDNYVVEEVDEDDSEKEGQLQPHQEKEIRGERKMHDPPGTLIDDIASQINVRGGRVMNRYQYHGRDPSVGGDSTRYSQPSVVRKQQPQSQSSASTQMRDVSPFVEGRDRPWRQSQQQRHQRQPHEANQSRSGSNHSNILNWYQPPDDDHWDIEFVSPSDNPHAACEASSLGNLTGEYDDPPMSTGDQDDDTATNTMNTVDLVAEVKRVWRHVQKYEKKKQKKMDLMAQYREGVEGVAEEEEEHPSMEAMMSHFQDMNQKEVSLDDTRVSDLTGFSQINNTGGALRSYGAGVPINGRRSPLEEHIHSTRGYVNNSPGQSYNNASHASTEKDVAFVNDGVDLFFDEAQNQSNANNVVHPRVPLSHHHKSTHYSSQGQGIPLSHHQKGSNFVQQESKKSINNHMSLAQPYDMTKSRSTGTALSSKTQRTSNRAPINSIYAAKNEEILSGKSASTGSNHTPSSPLQEYIQTHKARIDLARKYMKQHGGARFPRSKSPLMPLNSTVSADTNTSSQDQARHEVANGNARMSITHGNWKATSFRVT
jgi:hypothetical protein